MRTAPQAVRRRRTRTASPEAVRIEPRIEPLSVGETWRLLERQFRRARLAYGHGTSNAREEALWVIAHVLRIPFDAFGAALDRRVSSTAARRIAAIAARRVSSRRPLAHLLGSAWLGPYRFRVNRNVIVPRSFIASLLPDGLTPWLPEPSRVRRVLDLCTGSGCLAILAALAYPRAQVDAVELSAAALSVAKRNVSDYGFEQRIRLLQSDLFGTLGRRRYDLIIANPPYVDAQAMRRLPAEYRAEPELALAGGRDGLSIVHRILDGAYAHLSQSGVLVVEIGHHRAALERARRRMPFTWMDTPAGSDFVFLLERDALPAPAKT